METIKGHKQLIIDNNVAELGRVVAFLDTLEEEWMLPSSLMMPLNLVLEEAITNIILYAYDKESKNEIVIDFEKRENELEIKIIDSGKPFDPTLKPDPDTTLPVDARPIGGLGILLIKKIMDSVSYQRKENRNILIMTKKF